MPWDQKKYRARHLPPPCSVIDQAPLFICAKNACLAGRRPEKMDCDGGNQLPVMVDGQIRGMLGQDDLISLLHTLGEFTRK